MAGAVTALGSTKTSPALGAGADAGDDALGLAGAVAVAAGSAMAGMVIAGNAGFLATTGTLVTGTTGRIGLMATFWFDGTGPRSQNKAGTPSAAIHQKTQRDMQSPAHLELPDDHGHHGKAHGDDETAHHFQTAWEPRGVEHHEAQRAKNGSHREQIGGRRAVLFDFVERHGHCFVEDGWFFRVDHFVYLMGRTGKSL